MAPDKPGAVDRAGIPLEEGRRGRPIGQGLPLEAAVAGCRHAPRRVNEVSHIEWKPRSLADLSPLRHAYFLGALPTSGNPVLKVSLVGQAGNEPGHEGAFDQTRSGSKRYSESGLLEPRSTHWRT